MKNTLKAPTLLRSTSKFLSIAAIAGLASSSAQAALIISEGMNYTLASVSADPDAGVNSGNGLPTTNPGGTPSGTSTGLRGNYGANQTVVAGLTYSNSGGTLVTSGNAMRRDINNTANINVYRNMSTDPFLSERASSGAGFGVDGSSLFFSFLGQTSSATAGSFTLTLQDQQPTAPNFNISVQNTATGWQVNGSTSTTGLALNSPTFLVLRVDFAAGANDAYSLWVNPTLGQALGAADTSLTGQTFGNFERIITSTTVDGAMTYDEFRMGTTAMDVMPIPEPSAILLGAVGALVLLRRRR